MSKFSPLSCGITRQTDISLEEPHKFPKCFKPSVKATSNCLAKRSQFAIEKTLFAWRLQRSKVVVLDGGNLPVAGSKHVPPRKKGSFCEAAILIATWQSIPRTILIWCTMCSCWWYIYIYIYRLFFAVAAAFCHGETKYANRSEETEWILGALIPTQSYMCCSKLNTVFEMIADGSYATNRRQIALLSWQGMFLSYMFLPFNSPSVIQERW